MSLCSSHCRQPRLMYSSRWVSWARTARPLDTAALQAACEQAEISARPVAAQQNADVTQLHDRMHSCTIECRCNPVVMRPVDKYACTASLVLRFRKLSAREFYADSILVRIISVITWIQREDRGGPALHPHDSPAAAMRSANASNRYKGWLVQVPSIRQTAALDGAATVI